MSNLIDVYKCVRCKKLYEKNELENVNIIDYIPEEQPYLKNSKQIKGFVLCNDCIKDKETGYIDCLECEVCKITTLIEEVIRKKKTYDTIKTIDPSYRIKKENANIFGTYICLNCQAKQKTQTKTPTQIKTKTKSNAYYKPSYYKCTGCMKNFEEKEMKGSIIIDFDKNKLDKYIKSKDNIIGHFICNDCLKTGKGFICNIDCYVCRNCGITTKTDEVKRKKETNSTIKKLEEPYIIYEDEANVVGTYLCLHCQGHFH